jgi:hypothetical protein
VTTPDALDRRVPLRRPHTSPQRLQQIAAFIEEN